MVDVGLIAQRGAALLAAMLTVTLVAALASAALWQQWRATEIETAERARVQSAWILIGALDWSRLILHEDKRAGDADHLAEPWAVPLEEARLSTFLAAEGNVAQLEDASTDTTDAFLSGSMVDAQARLNVANLVDEQGRIVPSVQAQFRRLFDRLALPPSELELLAQSLQQAQNSDSNAPAPLRPRTLAQTRWWGIAPSTLARLAAHATLLPQPSKLNLNTADLEALLAGIDGLDEAAAQKLLAVRQLQHFRSLEDVRALVGAQVVLDASLHDVRSDYFEVRGRLRLGDITVEEHSLVLRQGLSVRTVWRERASLVAPSASAQSPSTMARETHP